MPTKMRLKIVALAFAPFFLAALVLYLLTQANIIEKDPTPFDGSELRAIYTSERGEIILSNAGVNSTYKISGMITGIIEVNKNGVTETTNGREAFTLLWLPFKNPDISLKTKNPEFQIFDSVGILGEPENLYAAHQEKSLILMDETLQSQASYEYAIFDERNQRVATGIYDATCGLLFRLQIKNQYRPDLRLAKTNFPISRNRIALGIFFALFSVGLLLTLFIKAKKAGSNARFGMRELRLIALGILCILTDTMLDIWYPFALSKFIPLIWHAILVLVLFFVGRRTCIPAIAELVMVFALWFYLNGPALPLFFIPGPTVSFILALGMRKNRV